MTIRSYLRKRTIAAFVGLFAYMLFVMPLFMPQRVGGTPDPWFPLAILPMFALMLYAVIGIRCPRCKTSVGWTFASSWSTFPFVKTKMNYCFGCGVSLDEKVE